MTVHMLSALLGGVIAVGISWLVLELLSHLIKDGTAGRAKKSSYPAPALQ